MTCSLDRSRLQFYKCPIIYPLAQSVKMECYKALWSFSRPNMIIYLSFYSLTQQAFLPFDLSGVLLLIPYDILYHIVSEVSVAFPKSWKKR